MMKFVKTFTWVLAAACMAAVLPAQAAKQPNIVLITADDLGFDDLSIHGNSVVTTPHLDQLAKQSVQFSDFQVTPVCSTTRAALLTGRHHYKTGVSGVHGGRDFMKLDEVLVSQLLKENGYATGTWGKWHVGKTAGYYPWDRGFDDGYYAELYVHENSIGLHNGKAVKHNAWVSDVITKYAIDFIDDNKQQPFFAYLSFLAPHEPWLAPDQFVEPYRQKGLREPVAQLYGMISEMDHHIGRLMAYLDESGLADNTIVLFLSDNGPWFDSSNLGAMTQQEWQQRNPNQYNGNKGQAWQNGIKSPLFVRWQGQFPAGKVHHLTSVMDVVPTLLELTGTKRQVAQLPLDGGSFAASLQQPTQAKAIERPTPVMVASHDVIANKPLFNQWTPVDDVAKQAINPSEQWVAWRTEQYKLHQFPPMDRKGYPRPHQGYVLVDMKADPKERSNIYLKEPELAKRLTAELLEGYQAIIDSPDSYKPPVYQIALEQADVSVVNAFGPSATWGNTRSKAHTLSQLKQMGDGAMYDIHVHQAGRYKVYLKQRQAIAAAGMEVALKQGLQTLEHELDETELQLLGELELDSGPQKFSFELTGNQSMKHWASLDGLRRFFFVKVDSQAQPEDLPLPN
ncbi:sulfatase-like hydrolase/transferase [Neiella marina]|nr:sulfatase-like hydrolase/transferase [Neiella marina]